MPQLRPACCWARCQDAGDLATLRVTRTLPADLNSFLFAMERDLASFAEVCRLLLPGPLQTLTYLQACNRLLALPHAQVTSIP